MTESAISVRSVSKSYKNLKAVDGISFEVRPGDFLAFLGPNGAGKATTIHSITGLCNFQQGSISIFGWDVVRDYQKARPLVGLCPQEFNFDPFLTIEQLLVYQAGYFGIGRREAVARARALLDRFRLLEKKDQDFRKLSGGMKRRLLICRALVHDPKILILDEPTAGADTELKYHIWDYLREINAGGKTIFLTTHYMEEAEKLSRNVIILDRGRIVHNGETSALIKDSSLEQKFLELTRKDDDAR